MQLIILAERERCAKIADAISEGGRVTGNVNWEAAADYIAAVIRGGVAPKNGTVSALSPTAEANIK